MVNHINQERRGNRRAGIVRRLAVIGVLAVIVGCGSPPAANPAPASPEVTLVGRWSGTCGPPGAGGGGAVSILEFLQDGRYTYTAADISSAGRYEVSDGRRVRLTFDEFDGAQAGEFAVTDSTLTLILDAETNPTDSSAVSCTLQRADQEAATAGPGSSAIATTTQGVETVQSMSTVDALGGWTDTSVTVTSGDEIEVSVISGEWTHWSGGYPLNDGQGNVQYRCAEHLAVAQCAEPFPAAPQGSLIADLGGTLTEIGSGTRFVAATSGSLRLRINDADGESASDNSGSLSVQITVFVRQ